MIALERQLSPRDSLPGLEANILAYIITLRF